MGKFTGIFILRLYIYKSGKKSNLVHTSCPVLLFPSAFDIFHFALLLSFSHSAVVSFSLEEKMAAQGHSAEHFGVAVSPNNWECPKNNNFCSVPVVPGRQGCFKLDSWLYLSSQMSLKDMFTGATLSEVHTMA